MSRARQNAPTSACDAAVMTETESSHHTPRWPKVAYVLVWFPKASETFVFREVCELRKLGLDVEVATLYGPLNKDLDAAMAGYAGPVTRLGIKGAPGMLRDLLWWLRRRPGTSLRCLGSVVRRWRSWETAGEALISVFCGFSFARLFLARGVQHIHADWANGPATAAWVASRLSGLPFSFTGRAGDIFPPDGALQEKARDCCAIRTDVARNTPYLVEQARVPADKVTLIHAALALNVDTPASPRLTPPYMLVAVGRFVPKKGYDILLEALALLRKGGWEITLTLAGSGPEERRLKTLCQELGLQDAVRFPGFVPHDAVPELLQQADCFVMSSRVSRSGDRDGIPNVILEAMAHGLPVVGTDVSGIGEVVQDGVTGVLTPPEDAAGLAEGVAKLLQDKERALRLARAGQKLVLERFDPQSRARDLAELYARCSRVKSG